MIRVLLVDDQSLLRMGFRLILEAEPDMEVVGEAGDGASGVSMASALHPDVVLMDVRMPGMDGIKATASIIEAGPASKVLILTTFDLDQYVFAGLKADASGFMLKDAPPAELLVAIRTVAGGDAVLAPTTTRRLIDQFARLLPDPGKQQDRDAVLSRLTDQERTVFAELAAGRSNREIATELHLSEGTVKTHVGGY
jgi:DNA-binding NarL/FixJ family response regulator